jgi:hypothetical protein
MRSTRLTTALTAGCALALAVAFGTAPVRAEDEPSFDTKIMRGLMEGLGLKRSGDAPIVYQERAPLVIPQGRDLPPPEKGDVASNNPAWPKDPDIARAREEERLERNRDVSAEMNSGVNPLRPDQLAPGANARTSARRGSSASNSTGPGVDRMSPSELGYKGGLFGGMFGSKDDEVGRFTGEPPRSSLTEPPRGYQTPSPDQPYGLGKAAAPKAEDSYSTRAEPRF